MPRIRLLTLIALAGAALLSTSVPAAAQSNNVRIQPQVGNVKPDGTRKLTDEQKKLPANAAQTLPPKKPGDNKGIGAAPIPLQKP